MDFTYYNGPLTICSGSQYRVRLESKLRKLTGEKIIVGPLDASIRKCIESGKIDAGKGEVLLDIARFCDMSYMNPESDPPSRSTIIAWSDAIESI